VKSFQESDIETVPAPLLYNDGEGFHFRVEKSFEQFAFSNENIDRSPVNCVATRPPAAQLDAALSFRQYPRRLHRR